MSPAIANDGSVYITGSLRNGTNFGGGVIPANHGFYLTKFNSDGTYAWANHVNGAWGNSVRLDSAGNVLAMGRYTDADFGAGLFDSEGASDPFLSMHTAGGQFLWAKKFPQALEGPLAAAEPVSNRIYIKGFYDGSMILDGVLLVNSLPEVMWQRDTFIGAFDQPCSTIGCDSTAPTLENMPLPIIIQAETPFGTVVKYTAPTAKDLGNTGANVSCLPDSGATFPIGVTTVGCTAKDSHGNPATASFTVTVVDNAAPRMIMPEDMTVTAAGPNGATVSYALPTAVDQISGNRTVTCVPAAGTLFAIGTTAVTCDASDAAGNPVTGTFNITVNPNPNATY
jgi:hypothetical protein